MYTIEAVRDMSFEILRTEKDMATHKKYVLGNLYIHTFLLWLFLSSLYRITATLEWVTTVFSVYVSSLSLSLSLSYSVDMPSFHLLPAW